MPGISPWDDLAQIRQIRRWLGYIDPGLVGLYVKDMLLAK